MNFFAFGVPKGPCRFPIGDLGGSDPVSTFGRQNRTSTRVAPAQIEVFACGLFAASFWPSRLLGGPLSRRAAEREAYVLTRTLRVFQFSGQSVIGLQEGGETRHLSFGVNAACGSVFTLAGALLNANGTF